MDTIPRLRCRIIGGGANNQILTEDDGDAIHARGILYAPDFAINAGGLINVADELSRAAIAANAPRPRPSRSSTR